MTADAITISKTDLTALAALAGEMAKQVAMVMHHQQEKCIANGHHKQEEQAA